MPTQLAYRPAFGIGFADNGEQFGAAAWLGNYEFCFAGCSQQECSVRLHGGEVGGSQEWPFNHIACGFAGAEPDEDGHKYLPTPEYQARLRELFGRYTYRLDTNYAKMDRIVHDELEAFKIRVGNTVCHGLTVSNWEKLFRASNRCAAEIAKYEKAKDSGCLTSA